MIPSVPQTWVHPLLLAIPVAVNDGSIPITRGLDELGIKLAPSQVLQAGCDQRRHL